MNNINIYHYTGGKPDGFEGEGITHVIVEDGVESIDYEAFEDWYQLVSIHIPPSVKRIGGYAFRGCISLVSVELPDSLRKIGERAFLHCERLLSIILPDSLNEMGVEAFDFCRSLTKVSIPPLITSIQSSTFNGCSSLSEVIIPPSVIEIGYEAFRCCRSLKSIKLPNGLQSIGQEAFGLCESLVKISIPPSLIEIGGHAFVRCCSLKSIKLPNGLQIIGGYAFNSCSSLESIQLPPSTTAMDRMTFNGCSSMKIVYSPSAALQNRSCLFVHFDPNLIILTDVDGFEYDGRQPCITLNNINQCIQDLPNNPIPPNQQLQTLHQVLQQRFPNIADRAQRYRFTLLHLIVYFPGDIYEPLLTLLTKCPEVIKAVDRNGKTPIHHVMTSTRHNMHPNCYDLLMRHCPDTVVHQAIRAGGLYGDDLQELLEAKSNALRLGDVESGLLPFMLATIHSSYTYTDDDVDLSVVYELLSMDPSVLKDYIL